MDETTLVSILIGGAVMLLVGGAFMLVTKSSNAHAEDRLAELSGGSRGARVEAAAGSLLKAPPIDAQQMRWLESILPDPEKFRRLYEQADIDLDFSKFVWIWGGLIAVAAIAGGLLLQPLLVVPLVLTVATLPVLYLNYRKKKRIRLFLDAMPQAVELMARALRAGHGLASGLHLVSQEMKGPIADEFGRVFEEQNLGIPIETSLRGLSDRIPAMDVKFLVTAIIIQRSAGGDLAEVLDKIGKLIRQRFELMGQVKALTAEGRLSGVILLALPPSLLAFLCFSNFTYMRVLFETPTGTKLLGLTAVFQVLGAIAIKKIVAIKV